jgi:hypothetical protein
MRLPEDLLEQAYHLARREPRRPKQASLRRAISTAYYALFHLLISEAIMNWKRPHERYAFARMFEHAYMRAACANKRDALNSYFKSSPSTGAELTISQNLHRVADTFVEMHQQREEADYDYSTRWSRTDVVPQVASVAAAFRARKAIRTENVAQDFLFTLLSKKRR